jgi:hypothetical protein
MLIDLILGAVVTAIFYWPGWLVLKILTVGRYPPPKGLEHNTGFVITFGMGVFIVTLGLIYS